MPAAQPVHPGGETLPQSSEVGNILRIGFVLLWTAILTFTYAGFSPYTTGRWIGALIIPLALALLVARVWKKDSLKSFSYWFLGFSLLVPVLSPRGSLPGLSPHNSLTRLSPPDRMKELIGKKPLERNLPQDQVEIANAIRGFFNEAKTWRKGYDAEVALIEPDLAKIYTAESFSSRAAMQKTLDAAAKQHNLYGGATWEIQQWPASIKRRLNETNISDAEKQDCIKHVMSEFAGTPFLTAREPMTPIERDWATSTSDLYSFALRNASHITVVKGKIIIIDGPIRELFNTKLRRAEMLRNDLVAASQKADDIGEAALKEYGVSSEDLGITK